MDLQTAETQAETVALQLIADRCKTDLFFLCKEVLAMDGSLITEQTHRDLCEITKPLIPGYDAAANPADLNIRTVTNDKGKKDEAMSDQFDENRNKLLLLMPRGTFKSSIVTIGFTLQYILNDPNARILIDSETYTKAKDFLVEVKGHLESNQKYRKIFKAIHGVFPDESKKNPSVRWTDRAVDLACRTRWTKEPSISCSGIDRSINGMHYDLIIADDLHSEKNTTNKEQIDQVKNHYKLVFSLLDPGKPIIVIGTRWDYQDLYQSILENERDSFNILVRQAKEKDGTLFFPERLTEAFLEEQKKRQGTYIHSCQYYNQPVDDDTATFKQSYIRYKKWEQVKDMPMNWFLAIDPSEEGPYSDYVAMVLAGMDYQQEIYVRKVYRAKMTDAQTINLMFDWYLKYQPRRIAVEIIATQSRFGKALLLEQKERGIWLPIKEIKSRESSKEDRIETLAPFYEFGRIHHIETCDQIDDLEYELLHFPKGSHDDMIDALATILEIAQPPTGRRVRPGAEERERKRTTDKPRSPVTGY